MGQQWPAMPPGTPMAWQEFQLNPMSNKLVDVFGTWITNGKINDIPGAALATMPPVINAGLDPNVVTPFVCSMPGDNGVRPGVPANFWATSLIFLVDPATGNTVTPANLAAGYEYWLVAVIGNRGANDGGRYLANNPTAAMQVSAGVMVWNSFDSPGVQLPSLSNLDVNDVNGLYEQYFLHAGHYDVVGFRLNVQTVFDGIIAALNFAVNNNGLNLGGMTPEQWVKSQPAHLCAKVVIRMQGTSFPNFGTTPDQDARIAQKNLAPFDVNITVSSNNPNINWKNFIVGQPIFFRLNQGEGRNTLILQTALHNENFRFFLGVPTETFNRFFREGGNGALKGWKVVPHEEICKGALGEKAKPFPDAVILQLQGKENAIEVPALPEGHFLAMSLGIEYITKGLKAGDLGELTFVQRAVLPVIKPGTRCFELEQRTVGGFTLLLRAVDDHRGPKGETMKYPRT